MLLLYIIALNTGVAVSQRDFWPFPTYPLVPSRYDIHAPNARMEYFGLTGDGREVPIDPYVWSPVFPLALDLWFRMHFPHLDAGQKAEAVAFLRDQAAARMDRLAHGERIGAERILGPAALPDYWLYVRPPHYRGPLYGLRVYRTEWRAAERYRDRNAVKRILVAESLR